MLYLFSISLRWNGFRIKAAQQEFAQILAIPDKDFPTYIKDKKLEIVNHHLENNNHYQKIVGTNSFVNWESLPVMTKKDFQKPLQERLSKNYNTKNIFTNKTSGSSGDPFVFAKDKPCHAITWASIMYRFGWFGIDFNQSYQARFYGIPLDFWGNAKERLKDFLSNRHRFNIFDLSDNALEKVLLKFTVSKFDYINGYTSSIVQFAKFLKQKNIVLKEVCPTLKVCIVTSEMLFDDDKQLLENQFGITIVNEYGASELDLIAFQNTANKWIVNSETLFVEILDDHNKVLPYGQEGKIVITSFYNKAHPFIRYDIGDIGILDPESTLRKPILQKLIGRTNDFAILPSGKKAAGLTFYYITKSIIEDDNNVKEFVITQTKIDSFEVEYVSKTALTNPQIKKIEAAISQYLEPNLHFIYIQKDFLQRSKSGKLKQFKSIVL